MRLGFKDGVFYFFCTPSEAATPRGAGFRFDTDLKVWCTKGHHVAARLIEYADHIAKTEITQVCIVRTDNPAAIIFPDDLKPKDYQLESARFALSRNKAYLGLDPGLGKTIVATLVGNTEPARTVVIAPPFLLYNWEFELSKWSTRWLDISQVTPKCEIFSDRTCDVLSIPDSILNRESVQEQIAVWAQKWRGQKTRLIVDEAHRYKTASSRRTKALLGRDCDAHQGVVAHFDHALFLSGTPMPNRPMELFPVLSRCARDSIGGRSFFGYAMRYCAAFKDTHGWDFSGASNMKELSSAVKESFMIRLKKDDVLKELEPKSRKMILLGEHLPRALAREDEKLLKQFSPEDLLGSLAPNGHVATYRKNLGLYKLGRATEYIRQILDETDAAVLVFAIHKAVIAGLATTLKDFDPVVITGDTPQKERHNLVQSFTSDPVKRLFIGNIQACGVGLNLQKATRVVFVEFSWVPSENEQAEDRAHRMGQRDIVHVDYLIYKNSIDRKVIETTLRKERTTKKL